MKILWLCSWYPNDLDAYGGDFIERHAKSLALHHPVDVIHIVQNQDLPMTGTQDKIIRTYAGIRVMVHVIPAVHSVISYWNKAVFNIRYFFRIRTILDDYVRSFGKPDIIHVHVPVKIGAGAIYLHEKYSIPFVVTEHNSAYFPNIPGHYHSLHPYYRWITRQSFRKALGVSSVSAWLTERLHDLFKPKQIKIIRNSVDTNLFYYTPSHSRVKRFIHVSMMESLKNVEGIVRAFIEVNQSVSEWELVLVGPVRDDVQLWIQKGDIADKVIMTGLIPYHEVATQMRRADVLVHFSRYENLPCVVNEALCCGLTVLSSNVGGIAEIVNEQNGILVRTEDINGLKNSIIYYLNNSDKYSREKIAENACSIFNYLEIGRQLVQWYQELVK